MPPDFGVSATAVAAPAAAVATPALVPSSFLFPPQAAMNAPAPATTAPYSARLRLSAAPVVLVRMASPCMCLRPLPVAAQSPPHESRGAYHRERHCQGALHANYPPLHLWHE